MPRPFYYQFSSNQLGYNYIFVIIDQKEAHNHGDDFDIWNIQMLPLKDVSHIIGKRT